MQESHEDVRQNVEATAEQAHRWENLLTHGSLGAWIEALVDDGEWGTVADVARVADECGYGTTSDAYDLMRDDILELDLVEDGDEGEPTGWRLVTGTGGPHSQVRVYPDGRAVAEGWTWGFAGRHEIRLEVPNLAENLTETNPLPVHR